MRYRVIRDGETINHVEWDRTTGWQPPEGCMLEPVVDEPETEPDPEALEATRLMHEAMGLLSQTDFVVIKATEKDRTLSPDWLAWRDELRAIVATRSGVIREEPGRYAADAPAPEPEPLAPESHFADLMLADETAEDAKVRLTEKLKLLRHYLMAPEIKVNEDGSFGLLKDEQDELKDLERRQAQGRWLDA